MNDKRAFTDIDKKTFLALFGFDDYQEVKPGVKNAFRSPPILNSLRKQSFPRLFFKPFSFGTLVSVHYAIAKKGEEYLGVLLDKTRYRSPIM